MPVVANLFTLLLSCYGAFQAYLSLYLMGRGRVEANKKRADEKISSARKILLKNFKTYVKLKMLNIQN